MAKRPFRLGSARLPGYCASRPSRKAKMGGRGLLARSGRLQVDVIVLRPRLAARADADGAAPAVDWWKRLFPAATRPCTWMPAALQMLPVDEGNLDSPSPMLFDEEESWNVLARTTPMPAVLGVDDATKPSCRRRRRPGVRDDDEVVEDEVLVVSVVAVGRIPPSVGAGLEWWSPQAGTVRGRGTPGRHELCDGADARSTRPDHGRPGRPAKW